MRVAVQGGGCSGFQYGLTFDNEEKPNDNVLDIDGLKVYVDAMSGMYLDGVKIDYIESLEGSGFKIENPNASGAAAAARASKRKAELQFTAQRRPGGAVRDRALR